MVHCGAGKDISQDERVVRALRTVRVGKGKEALQAEGE